MEAPIWTDQEIATSRDAVYNLMTSPYTSSGADFQKWMTQCERQSPYQKAACIGMESRRRKIETKAADAPRVLRIVRDQFEAFAARVRGATSRKEYDAALKWSAAEFYIFLVLDVCQRPWRFSPPGLDSSLASAWNKLPDEVRFLWDVGRFQKVIM